MREKKMRKIMRKRIMRNDEWGVGLAVAKAEDHHKQMDTNWTVGRRKKNRKTMRKRIMRTDRNTPMSRSRRSRTRRSRRPGGGVGGRSIHTEVSRCRAPSSPPPPGSCTQVPPVLVDT